ncbi:MAG: hypothetical protein OMM_03288 [Candidatus Magnetoglobus multicellularis str. Araruama]|uniref:ATPase n=1 Tax=Candidatus Magnetoglobus multicellularis str. Araruama TaxID=890399 RepID=A0A1V1P6E6_9BACT|nr:MAG: hypothetical protein OMM_03288 [Candidatus Magnetoglobus multicellularis str. Araruama]
MDFCRNFFMTFIYQYIAFKTRKTEYLYFFNRQKYIKAIDIARKESLEYLIPLIESVYDCEQSESVDTMWTTVRNAPFTVAQLAQEKIVQIIDEFQYLNSEIYRDRETKNLINDFAAGYMATAEYKNAPLLISGSWVGWLMKDLITMLPGRFQTLSLDPLPLDEAIEMIRKYANFYQIPITDDVMYLMASLCEGNPFYISSIMQGTYLKKDLTTRQGFLAILEFETLNPNGTIKKTWLDYFHAAISKINDQHARHIVLYLCKHRHRFVSKKEIKTQLQLEMTDDQLDQKLNALYMADMINRGGLNYKFQAVNDNIFDKVFMGEYGNDVDDFDTKEITQTYQRMIDDIQKKYRQLLGKYNQKMGLYTEYVLIDQLMYSAHKNSDYFKSLTHNLPQNFEFVKYERVWSYKASPVLRNDFQVDIFAKANEGTYSIIGEVKRRSTQKFSLKEARLFFEKIETLIQMEGLDKTWVQAFVYSVNGFYKNALTFMKKNGIAWCDDSNWLERHGVAS